jgi:hypothetical protein
VKTAAHYSVILAGIALSTGAAAGAALFVPAHEVSQFLSNICPTGGSDVAAESPYLAENSAAMSKMMNSMAAKPTGDVDTDFVAMMVPHHQGAIEMAIAVLRYGHNAQIRRLAQEIIVTQQQEIAVMRLALGEPLPPSTPSPTRLSARSPPETR